MASVIQQATTAQRFEVTELQPTSGGVRHRAALTQPAEGARGRLTGEARQQRQFTLGQGWNRTGGVSRWIDPQRQIHQGCQQAGGGIGFAQPEAAVQLPQAAGLQPGQGQTQPRFAAQQPREGAGPQHHQLAGGEADDISRAAPTGTERRHFTADLTGPQDGEHGLFAFTTKTADLHQALAQQKQPLRFVVLQHQLLTRCRRGVAVLLQQAGQLTGVELREQGHRGQVSGGKRRGWRHPDSAEVFIVMRITAAATLAGCNAHRFASGPWQRPVDSGGPCSARLCC